MCDTKTVFHPPKTFQYISSPKQEQASNIESTFTDTEKQETDQKDDSMKKSSHSSSSDSSNSDSDSDSGQHEFKTTSIYENSNINLPDLSQITSNLSKLF